MSIGGDGGMALMPFAACGVYAVIDRARRSFARRGLTCAVLAALPLARALVVVATKSDDDGSVSLLVVLSAAVAFLALEIGHRFAVLRHRTARR